MRKLVAISIAHVGCPTASSVTVAPAASTSSTAPSASTTTSAPTVRPTLTARFADLPLHMKHEICSEGFIAVVSGNAKVLGEDLAVGDTLVAIGQHELDVTGNGVIVFADAYAECDGIPSPTKHVLRASAAPELTWANGSMHAHLDGDGDRLAYVGRLEGTAAVAEHVHDTSWEVLCAIEASGTFTLAGVANRLSARECVSVPPNTKHAWTPDAGSRLRAIQFYDPPGPEQRFKALSATK